ncbi:DUF5999 family protein [Streptomyces sp. NPDC015350]|uniref:DUF5999 family protein n=1 Tax=Streptomyces sp. NPDC015350 TaxID=3364955 RepID=UPI003702236B
MCRHVPPCPSADASDCERARVVFRDDVQGMAGLCNGTLIFDDSGGLRADGQIIAPHRLMLTRSPA